MADFDLTQTDQQVQNILNDGQSAMGAGAQTTLTTEYVMLKDTNGVYHKILKSSFTEAIRDVLAGLLVNNDKGTTISQIAAIASGDFGSVTPANLASVLGVYIAKRYSQSYDSEKSTITLTWTPDHPNNAFYTIIVSLNRSNAVDCHQVFMFNGYGESTDGRTSGTKILGTAGSFSFDSNKIILTGESWRRVDVLQIGGNSGTWIISAT